MNKDHLAACDGLEDFKVSLGRGSVRATVDSDKEISNVTVGPETVSVGTDNVTSFVVVYRVQAVGRVPPDSKVQVHISVLVQRTYSQCEKVLIEVQQSPDWKLLCEVDRFGDVDLIGQDGSTPAHASVLEQCAPYFQPLLSERWSGDISCEKRLKLPLPVPANLETVQAFLKCLYGVPVVLQVLQWRGTSMPESIYQLADACSAREVCFQIVVCVELTEKNIAWWIKWLKWEHMPNEYQAMKQRVANFLQKHFAARWDLYEPDTLYALWETNKKSSAAGVSRTGASKNDGRAKA